MSSYERSPSEAAILILKLLGGVEREVVVEALEHEGKEMGPTGEAEISRQRP